MVQSGTVILKKGKEHSIERYHPWIFSGAIQEATGSLTDGCWVEVLSYRNKRLGFGHYQKGSIMVRMLQFGAEELGEHFWENKFRQALQLRKSAGLPTEATNAFRLIHGEGDGLPGLVVDFYNGVAIVQAHDAGMHEDRQRIAEALQK